VCVAIDYLKVWQAPKIEQLGPFFIAMVTPDSKKRDLVIYLGVPPEPSTCLAATPRLQASQKRGFATRRVPEFPRYHAGAVPVRVSVKADAPQIDMPAKAINSLSAYAAKSRAARVGVLSIWCWWRSECGR
jgi:hypothetical protein